MRLPYIGGAKGQVLEIRQRPDGTIFSRILMDEVKPDIKKEDFDALENTKGLLKPELSFEDSLASIQRAAAELVGLQTSYKENGGLSESQKRKYAENLEKLGISAQKLANVQEDDDYRLLLEGETKITKSFMAIKLSLTYSINTEPQGDRIKGSKKKPDNIKFPPYSKKPVAAPPKKEECGDEETVGEEGEPSSTSSSSSSSSSTSTTTTKAPEISSENENEAVSVTSADNEEDNQSVAEAKPGKSFQVFYSFMR